MSEEFPTPDWPRNPRPQCRPRVIPSPIRASFDREWRLLVDTRGVGALLGIPAAHVWTLHHSGRLPMPVRLGRTVRWSVSELRKWVASGCLPRQQWNRLRESGFVSR